MKPKYQIMSKKTSSSRKVKESRGLNSNNLIIRADANIQIGTGHVMRCLALAQAWQDAGGKVTFVMAMKPPAIEDRLRSEDIGVVYVDEIPGSTGDAIQTVVMAEQHDAQWIVVDGYHFDGAYQKEIKKSEKRLLFVDDYGHTDHYCADILLNQNLHAHDGLYGNREPDTKLLLGTRFVLLRREFLRWQGWEREVPPMARQILVTFGGSDEQNVTYKAVRALKQADLNGTDVSVIVGSANPDLEVIRNELMSSPFKSQLLNSVNDMATLMASADIAISASGSTCWELAYMGLPSLVLPLTDNQVPIANELGRRGIVVNLGGCGNISVPQITKITKELISSSNERTIMSKRGSTLIDGDGAARIVMYMQCGNSQSPSQISQECSR